MTITLFNEITDTDLHKRIDYIFKTFCLIYGIPHDVVTNLNHFNKKNNLIIYFGKNIDLLNNFNKKACIIQILPFRNSSKENEIKEFMEMSLKWIQNLYLDIQTNNSHFEQHNIYSKHINNIFLITVPIDIVYSMFYLISGYEEINSNEKDLHRRFNPEASILYKMDLLDKPVINMYMSLLNKLIELGYQEMMLPFMQKWFWPDGKKYAVCLTHDIDSLRKWTPYRLKSQLLKFNSLLLNYELKKAIKELFKPLSIMTNKNPYCNLEKIIELEKKYGFNSSFYFLAEVKKHNSKLRDNGYSITESRIRNLFKLILENRCEIGLHGSYDSYNNKEILLTEKKLIEEILGQPVSGIRQHYLRFEIPCTWRVQENSGFIYDATYGYAGFCGFRAGICHPFNPYDIQIERQMNIFENSTNIMDGTFLDYRNLTPVESWSIIQNLFETTKSYNGLITILWHNTTFDKSEFSGWDKLYEKCLFYLKESGAYVCTCEEAIDWWIKRNSLKFLEINQSENKTVWVIQATKDITKTWLKIAIPYKYFNVLIRGHRKNHSIETKGNIVFVKFEELRSNETVEIEVQLM